MAIKEAIYIRCDGDGCNTVVEIPNKSAVPNAWISIVIFQDVGSNPTFHLCSLKCVEKWAKGRKVAVKEQNGNWPCGICDYVSPSVQGLRAHERNAHGYHAPKESS